MLQTTVTSLKAKKNSKKGFTLMEMLIVVAIIAILVAIAIPVFTSQLTKAREAVDTANLRSCKSEAVAQAMLDSTGGGDYYGVMDAQGGLTVATAKSGSGYNEATQGTYTKGTAVIKVVVSDTYAVTSAVWDSAS